MIVIENIQHQLKFNAKYIKRIKKLHEEDRKSALPYSHPINRIQRKANTEWERK